MLVLPEVEQRVGLRGQRRRIVGIPLEGSLREGQRIVPAMPRDGERRETGKRERFLVLERHGPPQGLLRQVEKRRVAGLPLSLLIGEAEEGERRDVVAVRGHVRLERLHETRGVAGREASEQPLDLGARVPDDHRDVGRRRLGYRS